MALLEVACNSNGIALSAESPTYLAANGISLERRDARTKDSAAALLLTKRGWVVLDLSAGVTAVNGIRVAELKRIQDGDQITIRAASAHFREVSQTTLAPDTAPLLDGDRCLVDYCPFEPGQLVVHCPVCHAPHHKECWEFNAQTCAACGHGVPTAKEIPEVRSAMTEARDG